MGEQIAVKRPYRGRSVTVACLAGAVTFGGITFAGSTDPDAPVWLLAVMGLLTAMFLIALPGIWNRRIHLDPERLGVTPGLGRPGAWTDFVDVVDVVSSRVGSSGRRPRVDVILIARSGGHRGLAGFSARIFRYTIETEDRRRLSTLESTSGPLAQLNLPASELRPPESAELHEHLRAHIPGHLRERLDLVLSRLP